MSKVIEFPHVYAELLLYWSQKYGKNESVILLEYATIMAMQFYGGGNPPFEFDPVIEFHLNEMHKYFPGLKTNIIKKTLLSLHEKNVIRWEGDLENCGFLIFINHEELLKEFEEHFHE